MPSFSLDRFRNDRLFAQGQRALDDRDLDAAIEHFERYVSADDGNPSAWFNLGLAYKLNADWSNSVRANRRAAALDQAGEEAHWNLGVAATALRDWASAREAWRDLGLDPPPGDGPPEFANLGITPVRLNATGDGTEVVWGTRVDPCRARIESVPLPESGHRWGDVILHDVVPNGRRTIGERTWSVFDELIRMDPSASATFESNLTVPTDEDGAELQERFAALDAGAEDWTGSIEMLCAQCSVSDVHRHASPDDPTPIRMVVRRYGFGGDREVIASALEGWSRAGAGRAFEPLRQIG